MLTLTLTLTLTLPLPLPLTLTQPCTIQASRCFPTCSDHTHPLTAEELRASPLAQAAMHAV